MTTDITADLDDLPNVPPPRWAKHVFGHDTIIENFMQQFNAGSLHHAWLLAGPQGIGKATLAYHLAGIALGGQYQSQIQTLSHPNLYVLKRGLNDKGTPNSVITVENVRELNGFLHTTRVLPGWRVVIIDAVDAMNRNAANALLKSLEEPPANTLFILVCHSIGALLPTIRSRVFIQRVHPLNNEALTEVLHVLMPEHDSTPVVPLADGNVRKVYRLAQPQGRALVTAIEQEFTGVQWPTPSTFTLLDQIAAKGDVAQWYLLQETIVQHFRDRVHGHGHTTLNQLNTMAEVCSEIEVQFAEADEYNLDKHGVAFSVLHKARSVLLSLPN